MSHALLSLAFKNLSRNRKRTWITAAGIAAGTCAAFLFHGFVQHSYWGISERFARSGNGHIQIASPTWFDASAPEQHRTERAVLERVVHELRSNDAIGARLLATSLRRKISGIVSTGERSDVFVGYGVDASSNRAMSATIRIVAGTNLSAAQPTGVVLGRVLAERIGARPGDNVSILTSTDAGQTNAMDATVVGLSESGAKQADAVALLLPVETALRLVNSTKVDALSLALKRTKDTEPVLALVQSELARTGLPLEARGWPQVAEFYRAVKDLYGQIFGFVQLILILITALAVTNTIVMIVNERRQEIGMLQALGLNDREVLQLLVAEAFFLGLAGSLLGLGGAQAVALIVRALGGIPMPPPPGSSEGYTLNFLLGARGALSILAVTMLGTSAAAYLSSRKVSRQNISSALSGLGAMAIAVLIGIAALGASTPVRADEATHLLETFDELRGIPKSGFVLEATFRSYTEGESGENVVRYRVGGTGARTLAVAVSDAPGERLCILSSGGGMWMQKEGMRKSMRISPAQRLIGQAAIGDVVSVRFASDYEPQSFKDGVLSLAARTGQPAAYGKIELDIEAKTSRPVTARFYALSGKLLKTASYSYSAGPTPRLERSLISDAIQASRRTEIVFAAPGARGYSETLFNPESMIQLAHRVLERE